MGAKLMSRKSRQIWVKHNVGRAQRLKGYSETKPRLPFNCRQSFFFGNNKHWQFDSGSTIS